MCQPTIDLSSSYPGANNTKTALVLSTGSSFGNQYTTEQVLDALIKQQKLQGNANFDADFATRVLKGCGFKHHSIALPLEDVFRRFTRSEYLEHRMKNLTGLAEKAALKALESWGGDRSKITHLFWGTMTGAMHSPTIDIELVHRLGLNLDVERTSIEGMGCLTGFRLMNLARQVVQGDPKARVLVVEADLRSALGNSLPENPTRGDIVSVCLFRDAASSAIIGGSSQIQLGENPCFEIVTGASRIVSDTRHLVNYFETDDGSIRLHLSKELPDHIGLAEPEFVKDLLGKCKDVMVQQGCEEKLPSLEYFDVLCHTGGPRVLSEVAKSLGIDKSNMRSSWEVMTEYGNLSGASNLAVLDHHNQRAKQTSDTSEWALCLSMGPGVCLEGIVVRDVRKGYAQQPLITTAEKSRKVVHIVGCGIAGATLAASLDPKQFEVKLFEASQQVREQGYGLAIWPSTMKILREKLAIDGLDLKKSPSMTVRPSGDCKLEIKSPITNQDKGFMRRSTLLNNILEKVEERHPGCIYAGHRALRLRFEDNCTWTTYETCDPKRPLVSYPSHLLVGADGVNSVVRRYVALKNDSRQYGHMTAYRFLVPFPSKMLLEETQNSWNMSLGESIHSPAYHVSNDNDALNVVVLEYEGKPPSHPRSATIEELRDVAQRSGMRFIINLLDTEEIANLMCYSTFHIDCEPWYQPNAVLIGDAAHAYGPLTAKMANLAINDAYALACLLNGQKENKLSQEEVLDEWQWIQRPKFEVTKLRTLRHLQLYMPIARRLTRFFWWVFPTLTLGYFQSIFAYDYEVQGDTPNVHGRSSKELRGVCGVKTADPLNPYFMKCIIGSVFCIGIGFVIHLAHIYFGGIF